MKAFDAIKKGFEIIPKSIGIILVLFVFNLVWNLLTIPFTPAAPLETGAPAPMPPMLGLISIIFVLLSIFIQGGVLGSVRDAIKEGQAQLDRFTGYGGKFYLRLLGLGILIGLIIFVAAIVATVIASAATATGNGAIIAIAVIVALIIGALGVYLVILLFFSPYILVAEDSRIPAAMKASVTFVRQRLLSVIGLALLLGLIALGVGLIMGAITGVMSIAIGGKVIQVIFGIITSGVNACLSIIITASLLSYYLGSSQSEGASQTAQT